MKNPIDNIMASIGTDGMGKQIAQALLERYPELEADEFGVDKAHVLTLLILEDIDYRVSMHLTLGRCDTARRKNLAAGKDE